MKMILAQTTKTQLNQLGVMALYLFGSRAQNIASPQSDNENACCTLWSNTV